MNFDLALPALTIVFLLLMSAFFSGSETALTATSRARLTELERRGNKRAAAALSLTKMRERLIGEAEALAIPVIIPRAGLCTDNGAMIGAAGARRYAAGERAGLDLDARPSLPLAPR